MQLLASGYPAWAKVDQSYETLLATLRAQPGVTAAGATSTLPLDAGWRMPFQVEGRAAQAADYLVAQHICISSGYFETVGRRARGRTYVHAATIASTPSP